MKEFNYLCFDIVAMVAKCSQINTMYRFVHEQGAAAFAAVFCYESHKALRIKAHKWRVNQAVSVSFINLWANVSMMGLAQLCCVFHWCSVCVVDECLMFHFIEFVQMNQFSRNWKVSMIPRKFWYYLCFWFTRLMRWLNFNGFVAELETGNTLSELNSSQLIEISGIFGIAFLWNLTK